MKHRGSGESWSIVLAGDDNERRRPSAARIHDERPKEFVVRGPSSLFQDTLGRLSPLVRMERTVVVVDRPHVALAEAQAAVFGDADVVAQPGNLGTGAGLLLPLARIMARAPEATVFITPPDHDFRCPERILSRFPSAVWASAACRSGLCLMAVDADGPATDLGWIIPGAAMPEDMGAFSIHSFVEKPALCEARSLFRRRAMWNTFIMVATASRLWALLSRHLPPQVRAFERYMSAVDTSREDGVLREIYRDLPASDFSRDVLAKARGLSVVSVHGAGWSDWGTAERLFDALDQTPEIALLKRRLQEGPMSDGFANQPARAVS